MLALEPSATLAMSGKAKEMKAAGVTVYDLSLGEPDFNTPEHICQAAFEAIKSGKTRYTPAAGIMPLREAVAAAYKAKHGLEYKPTDVVVSNGAKHALHNAFTVTVNPGDEVIIPAPYWVSYAELVKLAGGIMTTHSKNADSRMEILSAYTALAGGSIELVRDIMKCISTDDALENIQREGLVEKVSELLMERIDFHMHHRTAGKIRTSAIMFSTQFGLLGKTKDADDMLRCLK